METSKFPVYFANDCSYSVSPCKTEIAKEIFEVLHKPVIVKEDGKVNALTLYLSARLRLTLILAAVAIYWLFSKN